MRSDLIRLSRCAPGVLGLITRIMREGPLGQRLREMGVIEGADVKVIRVAPLGDPLEIEVMGYLLSLRKSEAELVEIRVMA